MRATFLFILFMPALAFAKPDPELLKRVLESATSCSNYVRFDDENLYLGFGNYTKGFEEPRSPIPGKLQIVPLAAAGAAANLTTADAAIDSIRTNETLFVLTYSGIEEWDLAAKARKAIHETYAIGGTRAFMEHARAFAQFGDKAIIAHGRLGVSFFDLKAKRITNQFRLLQKQLPLESMATGVTVEGKFAYVVLDNFSLVSNGKPAFRGIVIIDMEREAVVAELDGLDPGADAVVSDGKRLIVSFGGNPVWRYSLSDLRGTSMPEPLNRIWRFPLPGNPTGTPAMDEKYYYSCFTRAPDHPGGPYRRIPVALNRAQLLLD